VKTVSTILAPLALFSMLNYPAWAAVVFVGVESGAPPKFQAQRWSLATESKVYAVTNHVFGCSGYYCLAPGPDQPSKPVTEGDITGNDTVLRKPDFLAAHPHVAAGTWVNYPGYSPDYVSVSEDASRKSVYNTAPLTRDGLPDLVLFDIEGKAGILFTVSLHRNTPADGAVVGFSLITFDRLSGADYEPAIPKVSAHIGQFERAGEYVKDYYAFKERDTFHLLKTNCNYIRFWDVNWDGDVPTVIYNK
jgi:hypothetical protein